MNKEIIKGLYEIRNKDNDNIYIGISNNIERRWNEHKEDLKLNIHHQKELQKEYNKLKEIYQNDTINHYEFNVLEQVETFNRNNMQVVEDFYILKNRNINYGYGQKTNYELYREDKCFIDLNFLINHKELNDIYYDIKRKERKQKLKENEKWQNLKLEYDNNYLYIDWFQDLKVYPVLSYFYTDNKDIAKREFNNITLKDIQDYVYYNISTTSIKRVLQLLYKNQLIKLNSDIKINKLKKDTIFSIELISSDKIITIIKDIFIKTTDNYMFNGKEHVYNGQINKIIKE